MRLSYGSGAFSGWGGYSWGMARCFAGRVTVRSSGVQFSYGRHAWASLRLLLFTPSPIFPNTPGRTRARDQTIPRSQRSTNPPHRSPPPTHCFLSAFPSLHPPERRAHQLPLPSSRENKEERRTARPNASRSGRDPLPSRILVRLDDRPGAPLPPRCCAILPLATPPRYPPLAPLLLGDEARLGAPAYDSGAGRVGPGAESSPRRGCRQHAGTPNQFRGRRDQEVPSSSLRAQGKRRCRSFGGDAPRHVPPD